MCLVQRKDCAIPEVNGFKMFSRDGTGQLQSVFLPTFKNGLKYLPNVRLRVDVADATFFAFAKLENAISIARQGRKRWNLVNSDIIVLPVTLYEVVAQGNYHVRSYDVQCLDGYYEAYESKEILVHDSVESRNQFYDATLKQWLSLKKYDMSKIEKEAFSARVPHLANFIK